MKNILYPAVVLFLAAMTSCSDLVSPQTDTTKLWPAGQTTEDGDVIYGYINRNGKMVIQPKFSYAESFSCGYAVTCIKGTDTYQYIDTKGNSISSFTSNNYLWPFYYNMAKYADENGNTGFINTDFLYAFEPQKGIRVLSSNMTKDGLITYNNSSSVGGYSYMVADRKSNTISITEKLAALKFNYAGEFIDNLAVVMTENGYGIINTDMEFTMKPTSNDYLLINLGNGLFAYKDVSATSYSYLTPFTKLIDKNGVTLTDGISYMYIEPFVEDESLTMFYDTNSRKYGYINSRGQEVISAQYDYAGNFSEGYAFIQNNKEPMKMIDKKNNIVLTLDDDEFTEMLVHNGLFCTFTEVFDNDNESIIYRYRDTKGKVIYSWTIDDIPTVLPCAPRQIKTEDGKLTKHYAIGCSYE